MTSYPSTVGVMGLSSSCSLPAGSDMERGQLENSTEASRVPLILARVTGLWRGGGVWLRTPRRSMQRDWRWEPNPFPGSSKQLETQPSDEARCGLLSLVLPPDKALSMGTGTGTKGEAIFLRSALLPRHRSRQRHWPCFASALVRDDGVKQDSSPWGVDSKHPAK